MKNYHQNTSLLSIFQHPLTYLTGSLLIMAWTGYHTYKLYLFSRPDATEVEQIFIIAGIVAIEFMVLIFTVNDVRDMAVIFSIATFVINLFVFWLDVPEQADFNLFSADAVPYFPGLVLSALISYCQYYINDCFYRYELSRNVGGLSGNGSEAPPSGSEIRYSDLENKISALERTLSNEREMRRRAEKEALRLEDFKSSLEKELSNLENNSISLEAHRKTTNILTQALDEIVTTRALLSRKTDSIRRNLQNWKSRMALTKDEQELNYASFQHEVYNRAYELASKSDG